MKREKRVLAALVLLLFSAALWADPWYMGQKITGFENSGIEHADTAQIEDIEYPYIQEIFTDRLFNELQSELYATNNFLYLLVDAKRDEGGVKLSVEFHELPFIEAVNWDGVERMRLSKLTGVSTATEDTFLDRQKLAESQNLIVDKYHEYGFPDVKVSSVENISDDEKSATITWKIEEGEQKKVYETRFEGNAFYDARLLEKQLATRISSYFTAGYYQKALVDQDIRNIETYYHNSGYLDAKVTGVDTSKLESDDEITHVALTYHIEEGDRWNYGGISFGGNTVFSDDQLREKISVEVGQPVNQAEMQKALEQLSMMYWDNGYVHSATTVDTVRDDETKSIHYIFNVDEKKQAVIEEIRLEGLTKTKPHVFLREMAFKTGDVFSRQKMLKSAQNIYNTLIVTDVQVNLIDGNEENSVIPIFTVEEGNQMTIQFGATFGGTVDSFPISGFLQWSDKNLWGTGRDLSISTTLSPDTQQVSLAFGDDWVKDLRWSNHFSLSFNHYTKENGLQKNASSDFFTGRSGATRETFPFGYTSYEKYVANNKANPSPEYLMKYDFFKCSASYDSGYTFVFKPGNLTLGGGISFGLNKATYADYYTPYEYLMTLYHDRPQFSNKLNFSVIWDHRDLKENTTSGYLVSNLFTYAGGMLGGLSNYLKNTVSGSVFFPVLRYKLEERDAAIVFGATSSLSLMMPQFWNNKHSKLSGHGWDWYDPKIGATRYEMLYIDGMNTARGFDVIYDQSFLWNNEISVNGPIVQNVLNWEAYTSATAVVDDWENITPGQMSWYFSLGAGIRMKVPGFPLGLYLVKKATVLSGESWKWNSGPLFSNGKEGRGMKLVLAITQTIY